MLGIILPSSVALLGIVVAIAIYLKQRPKLALTWEVLTDESIIVQDAVNGIVVAHEGVVIAHPRVLTIRIRNVGRREVTEADWRQDLTIHIPRAEIVDARVLGTSNHAQLHIGLNIMPDDTLTISPPMFLNPRMYVDLQLILNSKSTRGMTVTSIVLGESRSMHRSGKMPTTGLFVYLVGLVVFLGAAIGFSLTTSGPSIFSPTIPVLVLSILWTALVLPMMFRPQHESQKPQGPDDTEG